MHEHAILVDGEVVIVDNLIEWATWFEDAQRTVARLETDNGTVSTVFLGLNYAFHTDATPMWFETLVFGGTCDQYMDRYTTLEQAMAGHERIVQMVQSGECEDED